MCLYHKLYSKKCRNGNNRNNHNQRNHYIENAKSTSSPSPKRRKKSAKQNGKQSGKAKVTIKPRRRSKSRKLIESHNGREPEKECLHILVDASTKMDGDILYNVKFCLLSVDHITKINAMI